MKSKQFIFILFLLIPSLVKSQQPATAGDHLITATNNFYKGTALTVASIPFYIMAVNSKETINTDFFWVVGGGLSIVGIAFSFESFSHFKKAGKILNKKNIGISFNPKGIQLAYRF